MGTTAKPTDSSLVACEVCLKQVPVSEATVPEATDYFVHFCGLECYEKWKKRPDAAKEQKKASASQGH
jgi:hypothetical protein